MSPSVLARLNRPGGLGAKPKPEAAPRPRPQRSTPPSRAATKKASPAATTAEITARFSELSEVHGSQLDVFAVDPRPDLTPMRKEALKLRKAFARHAEDPDTHEAVASERELDLFVERLSRFRRRWTTLRDKFDRVLRTFRTVESSWAKRAEVLAETPAPHLKAETERLNRRVDTALRICEKYSNALAEEEPSFLGAELESLHEDYEGLEGRLTPLLARLDDDRRKRVAEAAAAEKRPSASKNRRAPRDAARPKPSQQGQTAEEFFAALGTPEASGSESGKSNARASKRTKLRSENADLRAEEQDSSEETTTVQRQRARSAGPPTILWAVVGIAGLALVFLFAKKQRATTAAGDGPAR